MCYNFGLESARARETVRGYLWGLWQWSDWHNEVHRVAELLAGLSCTALLELSNPEPSPECADAKDLPLRAWKPGEGGQPWSRAGDKDSKGIAARRQCSGNQCM